MIVLLLYSTWFSSLNLRMLPHVEHVGAFLEVWKSQRVFKIKKQTSGSCCGTMDSQGIVWAWLKDQAHLIVAVQYLVDVFQDAMWWSYRRKMWPQSHGPWCPFWAPASPERCRLSAPRPSWVAESERHSRAVRPLSWWLPHLRWVPQHPQLHTLPNTNINGQINQYTLCTMST